MGIAEDAMAFQKPTPTGIAADAAAFQQPAVGSVPDDVSVAPDTSNNPVVPEGMDWTNAGGLVVGGRKEPGFLKTLDLINTGVHRGVTHFTYSLMSKLPFGDRYQAAIKRADAEVEAEQEYNKKTYTGIAPQVGEIGGEMLATMPVGGLLGKVAQGAKALGAMAPTGLKTLAKYGAAAVGGGGVLTGMESQRYDPENPGQMINAEKAGEALSNPLTYAIPMAGQKLSTWMEASKNLEQAKEIIPSIMARDIKPASAARTFSQEVFDAVPALTRMGKRVNQLKNIGDDIGEYIKGVSGGLDSVYYKDLKAEAGKQLQGSLNVIKLKGKILWEKPFKDVPIPNVQGVKDDVINAMDILKDSGIPLEGKAIKFLQQGLRNDKMTVDNVKDLQSIIGDAAVNARNAGAGGIGNRMAKELTQAKDNLLNHIQNSLSAEDLKDFSAAREYSARQFQMYRDSPKLQKAIENEAAARNVILNLVGETENTSINKAGVMNLLSDRGRKATEAAKLAKALEQSGEEGGVNLTSFLEKTRQATQTPEVLGSEAYKSFEGFRDYLSAINEGGKVGWWRQAAATTAIAGATGAGAVTGGALGAAAVVVPYIAASFVANHSPLKSIFSALTKKLPESTYKALMNAAEKHLTRAGYLMKDGTLQHKDDNPINTEDDE